MVVHSADEKRKFIRVLPEVCLGDREEIVALIARMSPTDERPRPPRGDRGRERLPVPESSWRT